MKYYAYKMQMGILNTVAILLMIIGFIIYFWLFKDYTLEYFNLEFLIYLVFWMLLHELIHGISFMSFKGVKSKNVVFGAKLERGIFYCMCKQAIHKRIIVISLLAPLVFIGIITLVLSIINDWQTLALLSIFNISGSAGDIMMSFMFLKLSKDIKYIDLDDCEGFVILSGDSLENNKYLGFKLIDYGIYSEDIVPKCFKKINCSKASLVILVILFIAFVVNILI